MGFHFSSTGSPFLDTDPNMLQNCHTLKKISKSGEQNWGILHSGREVQVEGSLYETVAV